MALSDQNIVTARKKLSKELKILEMYVGKDTLCHCKLHKAKSVVVFY